MSSIVSVLCKVKTAINKADFLAPLAFRFYLAPILIVAGLGKTGDNFAGMVGWFDSLGMPAPAVMAALAIAAEVGGGFALLFGFAVRALAIPLMFTMAVAASIAHWDNGWFAIAPSDPDYSTAQFFDALGFEAAKESLENSEEVGKRVRAVKDLLKEHGNYSWFTGRGSLVVLNNGIEFAATYFFMLLSLLFTGGGRYVSVDYWLVRFFCRDKC
jgi:putative oxidoreductase